MTSLEICYSPCLMSRQGVTWIFTGICCWHSSGFGKAIGASGARIVCPACSNVIAIETMRN